ncbi:hypothetical protein DPMN_050890 [Dreissena polymorpha]|uniref:Uncharacterized protein n=1 Tax=Dreissena polymorpha TaxID=45954 RepID=A0A9D4CIZ1_DREPO|nr:hypothetical protein DPMN_050890 [Dreissena polymorpha]
MKMTVMKQERMRCLHVHYTSQQHPSTGNAHLDVNDQDPDRIKTLIEKTVKTYADPSVNTNKENGFLPKDGDKSNRGTSITSKIGIDC